VEGSRDPTQGATYVVRANLCRRRGGAVAYAFTVTGGNGEGYSAVKSVVVKSDGSLAWTWQTQRLDSGGQVTPSTVEVRRLDRAGQGLLDSSPDIDPFSLALAGSTLYWTHGGIAQSARLD
jgi:hypothetical protein